jgi:hypothetical protein
MLSSPGGSFGGMDGKEAALFVLDVSSWTSAAADEPQLLQIGEGAASESPWGMTCGALQSTLCQLAMVGEAVEVKMGRAENCLPSGCKDQTVGTLKEGVAAA